jgi:ABC-type transport system involved in cytochrome bd biosynthesis fused ATPase/permease subunit
MGFHNAHTAGEMIERIDGDVDALSNFFSQFVISLLTNVVLLLGVLIAVSFADWHAGFVLTAFALTALLALIRLRRYANPLYLFWSYAELLSQPIQQIRDQLQDLQRAEACAADRCAAKRHCAKPPLVRYCNIRVLEVFCRGSVFR